MLTILVAGLGGLGCIVSSLLIRSGIKKLYLVDFDKVEQSNLDRQILFNQGDIGKYKVLSAKEKLQLIDNNCYIETINKKIDEKFVLPKDIDGIVDCLDNFKTRFILDSKIFKFHKKVFLVHGGIKEFYGQVTVIKPGITKSLSDLIGSQKDIKVNYCYPPAVTIIGSIQADQVFKIIKNDFGILYNKLAIIDLKDYSIDIIDIDTGG